MLPREKKSKKQNRVDEPSVWSTGLVFATLIVLTALMFALAKKIAIQGVPQAETVTDIRAKR